MDRRRYRVWYKSPFVGAPSRYYYYNPDEGNHLTDIIRDASGNDVEDIVYYDLRDIILGNIEAGDEDKFIVEQCTGLRDKNKTLIYEGDVLNRNDAFVTNQRLIITWGDNVGGFVGKTNLGYIIDWQACEDIEIIGDVHEKDAPKMAYDKYRIWDTATRKYLQPETFYIDCIGQVWQEDADAADTVIFPRTNNGCIVEPSTGLLDVTGKPIFKDDRLVDRDGVKYTVFWKDAGFFAMVDGDFSPDIPLTQKWLDHWKLQVTGTTHDEEITDD